MIAKIKTKLRGTDQAYLFHDTRQDIRTLIKVIDLQTEKINELIDEINRMKEDGK